MAYSPISWTGCKLPLAVLAAMAVGVASCGPQRHAVAPAGQAVANDYSPQVLIVMFDPEIGDGPLRKAVKQYKAQIIYDYSIVPGMAIKKPGNKTLDEAVRYFQAVEGVVSVERDRICHLND